MHLHHVGGGGGGGRIMNVGGVTYSTDMGLGELQAIFHQILESRFTCNQGAENVSFSASIPVHTCNDH